MATSSTVPSQVKSLLSSFISTVSPNKDIANIKSAVDDNQANSSAKETLETTCTSAARNKMLYYDRVETYSYHYYSDETLQSGVIDYLKRLQTGGFRWFAKPFNLSPLVCARYGWVNTESDMLQCVNCKAFLSGQLPKAVNTQVYKESCNKLKKGLTNYHEKLCTWSTNPCPESFSKVPYHNREELVRNFQHRFASLKDTATNLPSITYNSLTEQNLTMEKLQILVEEILKHSMLSHVEDLQTELTLYAVSGWAYSEGQIDVLQCSYCRRKVGLWNYNYTDESKKSNKIQTSEGGGTVAEVTNDEEEPPKKRTKVEKHSFDPVAEHRYWCPWIQPATMSLVTQQVVRSSPQSTPNKDQSPSISPSTTPRQSPGSQCDKTEDTARVPAWHLVMRILSHSGQKQDEDFCSQMKQRPQLEGLRHLRKVLQACTSPPKVL